MPHLSPSQAQRLLAQYRASGLSQQAFRKKHRISTSLFAYWLPRFEAPFSTTKPAFQELALPHPRSSPASCSLTLPSGAKIEFPASQLALAIAALTATPTPC